MLHYSEPVDKVLIDPHGRRMKKLRLNLLDACNMRCMYCMPENQKFKKTDFLLSPQEIGRIVSNLKSFGIEELRLTGGEPLLHPHFKSIVKSLAPLSLKKFGVTTNGLLLRQHLDFFEEHGLTSLNVSLDSLQPASFKYITKSDSLGKVLDGILEAKRRGFNVKTNTIMLKNINFEELEDFLKFSAKYEIETRFLELMKIGEALDKHERHFVAADEAIIKISESWELVKVPMPFDSTSFNFIANKNGLAAKIGFIASETKPFCNGCSRLRLSNEGVLRPCIMINDGPNLKELPLSEYERTLEQLVERKPINRPYGTKIKMNEIGG